MSDSRRQLKRLGEKGEVKFVVGGDPKFNARVIGGMIHQKRRRYKDIGARDLLQSKACQEFYKNISDAKLVWHQQYQFSVFDQESSGII